MHSGPLDRYGLLNLSAQAGRVPHQSCRLTMCRFRPGAGLEIPMILVGIIVVLWFGRQREMNVLFQSYFNVMLFITYKWFQVFLVFLYIY